jgi:hypothetical protein
MGGNGSSWVGQQRCRDSHGHAVHALPLRSRHYQPAQGDWHEVQVKMIGFNGAYLGAPPCGLSLLK